MLKLYWNKFVSDVCQIFKLRRHAVPHNPGRDLKEIVTVTLAVKIIKKVLYFYQKIDNLQLWLFTSLFTLEETAFFWLTENQSSGLR